jgi:Xaa-Pro dipeptidase
VDLIAEKIAQAKRLVAASDLDVWCTFVRETSEGSDPILPFLIAGGLTWQTAILIFKSGKTVVVVGNFDADPICATGHWDKVVPYVQGIREPLLSLLAEELPSGGRVGVNTSPSDVKADGLTHGMYNLLAEYLDGTAFQIVSAEGVCGALRSRKTPTEIGHMRGAIAETELIFARVPEWCQTMPTEVDVFRRIQAMMDRKGLGYAWDRVQDPIVNSGPDSMVGHGVPSASITVSPGHIFHIDLGVVWQGYSSDIQRCWYVPERGESMPPPDVIKAFNTVVDAITVGADHLRPGVEGWQVDAAARAHIAKCGYPEYMHALGHQVGRVAHDGGGLLGPRWERYGRTPCMPVECDQVYTIELGVFVEGRGYLGLEEMVLVEEYGLVWLTERQLEMPLL